MIDVRDCAECRSRFVPRYRGSRQRYCSEKCRRQRVRRLAVERRERDQPTCERCGVEFTPCSPWRRQRFCSHACSNRSRNPVAGFGCEVPGCDRSAQAHGGGRRLCGAHYYRFRKYGSAQDEIPVRERGPNGTYSEHQGYLRTGKRAVHRIVMEEHLGRELLPTEVVHHRNGVRSDNRIENLELWSISHPKGARTDDLVEYALEVLRLYAPERLAERELRLMRTAA